MCALRLITFYKFYYVEKKEKVEKRHFTSVAMTESIIWRPKKECNHVLILPLEGPNCGLFQINVPAVNRRRKSLNFKKDSHHVGKADWFSGKIFSGIFSVSNFQI